MKYRVTIRGQKGDYKVEIECDAIEFKNSWWAVFYREGYTLRPDGSRVKPGEIYLTSDKVIHVDPVIVAAVPSEHLNLIERVEPTPAPAHPPARSPLA